MFGFWGEAEKPIKDDDGKKMTTNDEGENKIPDTPESLSVAEETLDDIPEMSNGAVHGLDEIPENRISKNENTIDSSHSVSRKIALAPRHYSLSEVSTAPSSTLSLKQPPSPVYLGAERVAELRLHSAVTAGGARTPGAGRGNRVPEPAAAPPSAAEGEKSAEGREPKRPARTRPAAPPPLLTAAPRPRPSILSVFEPFAGFWSGPSSCKGSTMSRDDEQEVFSRPPSRASSLANDDRPPAPRPQGVDGSGPSGGLFSGSAPPGRGASESSLPATTAPAPGKQLPDAAAEADLSDGAPADLGAVTYEEYFHCVDLGAQLAAPGECDA